MEGGDTLSLLLFFVRENLGQVWNCVKVLCADCVA
jgi:hypothetical protein